MRATTIHRHRPAGITLTEILIAIFILAIGLVSLATLFPIGLLRLRDANRSTRSAFLALSAGADASMRSLFSDQSIAYPDYMNYEYSVANSLTTYLPIWYPSTAPKKQDANGNYLPFGYNPLTQDTAYYGAFDYTNNLGVNASLANSATAVGRLSGPGLPFAYDPLWRYQTGIYLDPTNTSGNNIPECRFGAGIGFLRADPSFAASLDTNSVPSAHGLQRLTSFNDPSNPPYMVSARQTVPNAFVSPEDVVWQDANQQNTYTVDGSTVSKTQNPNQLNVVNVTSPSPILPDLSLNSTPTASNATLGVVANNPGVGVLTNDFRYSWMFTGQQTNQSNASCFDGNIVIFEARPFAVDSPTTIPNPPPAASGFATTVIAGETVTEAVFGYSDTILVDAGDGFTYGYGASADRTVLLRWYNSVADPVVKVGDWFADVTYERTFASTLNRFYSFSSNSTPAVVGGVPNLANKLEWDNLPAQRCFWYQVQKVTQLDQDPYDPTKFRAMVVYVNQPLQARTLLQSNGQPLVLNAALIVPSVVNVIPQTIFNR